MDRLTELKEVISRHKPKILGHPGVLSVSPRRGTDRTLCIGVLVSPLYHEQTNGLPEQIEGYRVRISDGLTEDVSIPGTPPAL